MTTTANTTKPKFKFEVMFGDGTVGMTRDGLLTREEAAKSIKTFRQDSNYRVVRNENAFCVQVSDTKTMLVLTEVYEGNK